MQISISKHNTYNYTAKNFDNLKELTKLLTSENNYSCGIFKGGHRTNENFIKTYTIGLDIDNGVNEAQMTLGEAKTLFKDHKHIIMPSKSHQIDKNGTVADRFRIILFLTTPIDNKSDYYATWHTLKEQYPAIDRQCKDPARFWYPSTKVVSYAETGKTVEVVKHVADIPKETKVETINKGKLARATMEFISFGPISGQRNAMLTKAVIDIREQGYNKEECVSMIERAMMGNYSDEEQRCIDSTYSREMLYPPRDNDESFTIQTMDEVYNNTSVVEWSVEKMLMKGGLSIVAGNPKSGKSTIVRQLVKNLVNGEEFLGRKTHQDSVLYLALEEFESMIKDQFKAVGVKKDDPIYLHVGMFKNFDKRYENLEKTINKLGVGFVVIDTMSLFTSISDLNDYNIVNKALTTMREIARNTGAHILLIHHLSKGFQGKQGTILGSQAITGAVDNIVQLNRKGYERFLDSDGRGCRLFQNQPLEFDRESETYTLGEKKDDL